MVTEGATAAATTTILLLVLVVVVTVTALVTVVAATAVTVVAPASKAIVTGRRVLGAGVSTANALQPTEDAIIAVTVLTLVVGSSPSRRRLWCQQAAVQTLLEVGRVPRYSRTARAVHTQPPVQTHGSHQGPRGVYHHPAHDTGTQAAQPQHGVHSQDGLHAAGWGD